MTERITYIELDLDRCSLTYGSSPCTAAIGVTGERKCFNCLATCQDKDHYASETVTARYSKASGALPVEIDAIPSIQDVSLRPQKLELGESIGIRASMTVTFKDHRYPDTGPEGDRYLDDREYEPYTLGTYFGKFRTRYPYTRFNDIRLIRGTSDQPLDQMETRHFIVDSVAGPTSSGTFTITAKDALKLADGDKAQAPLLSDGYLSADISDTATSFTLEPVGIGNLSYPESGTGQIGGKEIVEYTRSGDTVTLGTRGARGTTAQEHDAEDRFQICLTYTGQEVTAIIEDLLVNYAGVPSEYISTGTWLSEDEAYIGRVYTATIGEPTAVKDLINELLRQTASTIWWDDIAKIIRFRVLRQVSSDAALYNDDLIVGGSFSAKDQPDKRVSQVWTFYGQLNPLEDLDDPKNYSVSLRTVNLVSETNFGGSPAIERIYSRWIISSGRNAVERLNNLILARYSTPPRLLAFQLQRDPDLFQPEIAGGYNVNNWTLQDDTGASKTLAAQVVQCNNTDTGHNVLAEEVLYTDTVAPDDPTARPIRLVDIENNVSLRDKYDALYGEPDASTIIIVTIEAGAIIGSTSTSLYALRTGLWPEGPTITINNFGRVQGKGGSGGRGALITSDGGTDGYTGNSGGDAMLVEYDVSIDNTSGDIWSGGGGGGGGGHAGAVTPSTNVRVIVSGSGGGAAAGTSSSSGGLGGVNNFTTDGGGTLIKEVGNTGQSSTSASPGDGGVGVSAGGSGTNATGGDGGDGGGPGLSGSSGTAGVANGTNTSVTSGGAGGSPGYAIVQTTGTATITVTGDIRGGVV